MLESIGWVATALFGASYFFKAPNRLRMVQAVAAVLWIGYGLVIGAAPVIAANVVVAGLAIGSTLRSRRAEQRQGQMDLPASAPILGSTHPSNTVGRMIVQRSAAIASDSC
jgi:hypothetical protein